MDKVKIPSGFINIWLFEVIILILALGSPIFWIANKLVMKQEKLIKPHIADHFRQSGLYYLLLVSISIYLFRYSHGFEMFYILMILGISVWAIIINSIFLYKQLKTNI